MSLSLEQAQAMSIGELAGVTAAELMRVQAEAANYLRNAKELKDWIDGPMDSTCSPTKASSCIQRKQPYRSARRATSKEPTYSTHLPAKSWPARQSKYSSSNDGAR